MTRSHRAAEIGPLFAWSSTRSAPSGTAGPIENTQENPKVPEAVPPVPVQSGRAVPYETGSIPGNHNDSHGSRFLCPRERPPENINDSGKVPRSLFHPLRGDTSRELSGVPFVSSAALTLRSQRTDTRDPDPGPGPNTDQNPPASSATEQPALSARPYQAGAIEAVEAQFRAGVKSTLVVVPTGAGKTIVLALLLLRYKLQHEGRRARGLVIAHRTELIQQNASKCRTAGLTTSIEQGESRASRSSDVVVASVQTLQRSRLLRFAPDEFDYIVIDEAHHSAAKGYQNILDHFPGALVLGLTASPMRLDGKPLGDTFETVAYTYELRAAIRDQWLVPIRAHRVRITDVDMSEVKAQHGDLAKEQLGEVLRDVKALQGVVGPTMSLAGRRRSLVFAVDVAHAHALADLFNKHKPGSAMALDGTMPDAKRKAVLQLFREGAFQYLVNCEVLTEGFDDPGIECVVLARPTMSVALLIQMIGRGTRLLGQTYAESVANGKSEVLVLDIVGNLRHRLAGPADALAGMMLPPELQAEVDAQLANGKAADIDLVLAGAEERVDEERRRKAELALAYYRTKEVDPFVGEFLGGYDQANAEPATSEQLSRLTATPPDGFGFSDPPPGLTRSHAQAIIDAAEERNRRGLASLPQIRVLRKVGIDARGCSKKRASELFMKAKRFGYSLAVFRGEPEFDGRTSWK